MSNINLPEYMANPKAFIIKKWMHQLIGDKAAEHFDIIDRISHALATQKDMEDFSRLLGLAYEAGFFRAVNDYKNELQKHNIKIKIDTEKVNAVHS